VGGRIGTAQGRYGQTQSGREEKVASKQLIPLLNYRIRVAQKLASACQDVPGRAFLINMVNRIPPLFAPLNQALVQIAISAYHSRPSPVTIVDSARCDRKINKILGKRVMQAILTTEFLNNNK
jgi:hypothetical protein